ncbi:MAG: hypothetical protein CSA81_07265 [Acidobacteria bacterium]|nr:MAG: hypothetical protein CSA81_07265 [Acidobacteriota bacterium]
MYQETAHKVAGCAFVVLGVHTRLDRLIFILLYNIFDMIFQSEREKNNPIKIIRVNSCPFVVTNKLTMQTLLFL